ncbi:MAG TPA: sodium:alanine symporter family protein [Candidatus Stackebrandtia faecavium]|nr:sodium:alanine symporter family protein [Candidatus Stackebrandtia faecavium]
MESWTSFIEAINEYIWGTGIFGITSILVPLLLGTGIYLTIRIRGLTLRKLFAALKYGLITRKEHTEHGDISHYRALMAALSGTVGTGNVGGVATAIALGGPGALFWMWITALFGLATKYAEAILGVKYRTTDERGEKVGGPMYYLSRGVGGFHGRSLGFLFAVFAAISAFGIGNTVQSNATTSYINATFNVPTWISGIVLMLLAGFVILGGIKRIGTFAGYLVPFMLLLYLVGGLTLLTMHASALPAAFQLIFESAFTGTSMTGGFAGAGVLFAIQYGVARGIFSNESGLGTGGIAAASAQTTAPVRQGMVSMTQTFIDTIVICSITGLSIIVTGAWTSNSDPDLLTQVAFSQSMGQVGAILVTIVLSLFTFTTLLTWGYYGERNIVYLFGRKGVLPYRIVFIALIFFGSVLTLEFVWAFATMMNGLMALPNLIGLLFLSGVVWRETRDYFKRTNGKLAPVESVSRGDADTA